MSKVIGYLPSNIPRILINRTIVQPKRSHIEADDNDDEESSDEEKEFREGYAFDAFLLGFCDDVTRLLAKRLFADEQTSSTEARDQHETPCEILSLIRKNSEVAEMEKEKKSTSGGGLSDDEEDPDPDMFKAEDWRNCEIPEERVFLFPGAQPVKGSGYGDDEDEEDGNSEVTFREVAHCDGCTKRIVGTIMKCNQCFDYDLCQKCFPKLSKTHCNGEHMFAMEAAAPFEEA